MRGDGAVLIVGGQFGNQGAYLMLRAAAAAVSTRLSMSPVVDVSLGTALQRSQAGVGTLWTPRRWAPIPVRSTHRPSGLKRIQPYASASEVKAVLDISGFRYGDAWESLPLDKHASYLSYWHSRGVPVIMLPQAFGPFERTRVPSAMALNGAMKVYARDPDSARYAQALMQEHDRLEVAPDFTSMLDGYLPDSLSYLSGWAAVVVNSNITDRAQDINVARQRYMDHLARMISGVRALGIRPYGLVHGGSRDRELMGDLVDRVGEMPVLENLNGLVQKGLLGSARVVISGRFHATVSALNQAVPTVIHGWSHKYAWLAEQYGMKHALVDPIAPGSFDPDLVAGLVGSADLPSRLLQRALELKAETDSMWRTIERSLATG